MQTALFPHLARSAAMLALVLTGCSGDEGGDDTGSVVSEDYTSTVLAADWASGLTIDESGGTLTFTGDGLPDHDILQAYAAPTDNSTFSVVGYDLSVEIPAEPVWSETTTATSLGTIGIAISGGVYFNPYEGDGTSVAIDSNFTNTDGVPFIDSCSGHPLPSGDSYHYHGVPYCITDVVDTDAEHSVIIGLLRDGYPIYGPQGEGGSAPTDLDACSGHTGPTPEFPGGVYHYHLTETSPYSITCYHGEVEATPMGP